MRSWGLILLSCLLVGASAPAFARATTFTPLQNAFPPTPLPEGDIVSEDKPVVLSADRVDYHQQEDIISASGHVEIVQGDTMVIADTIIYDRTKNIMTARGNVSVMDAMGSVIFADEIELRDDLARGVVEQFRMRLIDDSLFAANSAKRVDENVMEMDSVVYSPCKVKCADDLKEGESPHAPLWQLSADHVKVDQLAQTVEYDDAWMEVYGVPVFYTPYLSHATPNADGKAGLMVPELRKDDTLGNVYTLPFYYPIAQDRDIIVTPEQTSKEGFLLKSSYRQKFNNGQWDVDGSITNPRERDALGNLAPGRQFRGHLYTIGAFDVDEDTRWGFDIKRTTDDTYLRKYDIDNETLLISKVFGETYDFVGSSDRSSLTTEALAFQGLAATDNAKQIPLILPLVTFDYESEPMANNSRYFVDSNALLLTRDMGAQSRRLSNTVGWRLPYITGDGQVIELSTQLRGDVYDVGDVALSNGQIFDGVTGRLVPEASALWRYPFISEMGETSVMVEPVVSMAVSPNGGNPEKIPNEDSLVPEFTDTNLFSSNRFAGYDRIEHGARASYGLRGLVNYKKAYIDWLLGQHYRMEEDRNFPFSNDVTDNLSDYVGKVSLQYSPLYIAYRFRLDKETLSARRQEFDLGYTSKRFTMTASYLSLQNDPVFASRQELVADARVQVLKHWLVGAGFRRDLLIDQLTNAGVELTFKNECVNISNVISREYTRDREVKPNTSYLIRVSLKSLN